MNKNSNPHKAYKNINIEPIIFMISEKIPLVDGSLKWDITKFDSVDLCDFKQDDYVVVSSTLYENGFITLYKNISIKLLQRNYIELKYFNRTELVYATSVELLKTFDIHIEPRLSACIDNLVSKNKEEYDLKFKLVKTR